MDMQISDFAALTGVSIRTLHYYDEIGLLPPARVDGLTGYRYYDGESLLRMQEILFYRELDFPLKRIRQILSSPDYNKEAALREQQQLLRLKKARLEKLIAAIDGAVKGENVMTAFDNTDVEAWKAEAQARWGQTAAWQEHAEKTRRYTSADWRSVAGGLEDVFAAFAQARSEGAAPGDPRSQALVRRLQQHITDTCYTCTTEILAGLGQTYAADERFRRNIDRHGEGTADFVAEAIAAFCAP